MTSAVTLVDPADPDWVSPSGPGPALRRVLDAASVEDGSAPLDEAALLTLRQGLRGSRMWAAGTEGFAWRHGSALDVVVAPAARGRGLGTALVEAATETSGRLTAWSHGNHPAAASLARRFGFDRVRDLWVMRRALGDLRRVAGDPSPLNGDGSPLDGDGSPLDSDGSPLSSGLGSRTMGLGSPSTGVEVRTFRVGRDEDAFLALNAEAFAHHPEQGGLTREDLDLRMSEPWFDPAGFFLAWRDDRLEGFHWTKVHADEQPSYGEVYVVGVSPSAQGGGLGRQLTLAGLRHLASLGLDEVVLYVEADNAPAVATYQRVGFTHAAQDTHVQYARP